MDTDSELPRGASRWAGMPICSFTLLPESEGDGLKTLEAKCNHFYNFSFSMSEPRSTQKAYLHMFHDFFGFFY